MENWKKNKKVEKMLDPWYVVFSFGKNQLSGQAPATGRLL